MAVVNSDTIAPLQRNTRVDALTGRPLIEWPGLDAPRAIDHGNQNPQPTDLGARVDLPTASDR